MKIIKKVSNSGPRAKRLSPEGANVNFASDPLLFIHS